MAKPLNAQQREELERRAWALRVKGWSQPRIAAELDVDTSTVCRMLQRINTRLAKEFEKTAAQIKAEQTAQLDYVYEQALEQWDRSCQPAECVRIVKKRIEREERDSDEDEELEPEEPGDEYLVEYVRETRGQSGNPALLAQALAAKAAVRQIWGLNAVKKTDITSAGQPFKVYVGFDPDADDAEPEPEPPSEGDEE
ncbi:MAG: helix-turn-helix domain-containing protein [Armatimonadota bacterium]